MPLNKSGDTIDREVVYEFAAKLFEDELVSSDVNKNTRAALGCWPTKSEWGPMASGLYLLQKMVIRHRIQVITKPLHSI
jgi:hypothetical protein